MLASTKTGLLFAFAVIIIQFGLRWCEVTGCYLGQYACTRNKFNFGRAIGIASRLISENTEFNSPHVYGAYVGQRAKIA